jgi:hypothetical protein
MRQYATIYPVAPTNQRHTKEVKMKRYKVEVVSQVLYIIAEDEEQAEAKYDAYWSNSCICGASVCACVEEHSEVSHITSNDDDMDCCSVCGEIKDTDGGEFEFASPLHPYFTCRDCIEDEFSANDDNANPDNHFTAPKENDSIESN